MSKLFGLTLALFLLTWIPISGFADPIDSTDLKAKLLFPQNIGDEHTYHKTGKLVGENSEWTDKITEKNANAFKHSNFWGDGVERTVILKKNGVVLEELKGKPSKPVKFIWYRFNNLLNQEWIVKMQIPLICVDGATAKITSRSEKVEVPAGTFENCVRIEYKADCADAGITEQWFAPNIGLVKQTDTTIAGPITSELVKAKVGSTTYPQQ